MLWYEKESSDSSISLAVPSMVLEAREEGSWQILVTLNLVEPRILAPTKSLNVRAGKAPLRSSHPALMLDNREGVCSKVGYCVKAEVGMESRSHHYQQPWSPPRALGYVCLHGVEEKISTY